MKKESTKLKASNFKYPSKEERSKAIKGYPKIAYFHFAYKSELESILIESMTINEVERTGNLFWWNNCLINRFGKLQETYVYTMTCYNRKFSDDILECTEAEAVNNLLFNYYAEIFYYYFFSARDILGQVLRVYLRLKIKEDELYFNKEFIRKVKAVDSNVGSILEKFFITTKKASSLRNGFAHKFSPSEADFRPVCSEENGKLTLEMRSGQYTTSDEIVNNINDSLNSLKVLMQNLTTSVK